MCDYGVERSAVLSDNLTKRNRVEMGVVACDYGAERIGGGDARLRCGTEWGSCRAITVRDGMRVRGVRGDGSVSPETCSRNACSYLRPVREGMSISPPGACRVCRGK